eukprot:s6232_g1.t1
MALSCMRSASEDEYAETMNEAVTTHAGPKPIDSNSAMNNADTGGRRIYQSTTFLTCSQKTGYASLCFREQTVLSLTGLLYYLLRTLRCRGVRFHSWP